MVRLQTFLNWARDRLLHPWNPNYGGPDGSVPLRVLQDNCERQQGIFLKDVKVFCMNNHKIICKELTLTSLKTVKKTFQLAQTAYRLQQMKWLLH